MDASRPLTSVVIPTRNRAEVVLRAIRSVTAQEYEHMEILIVDDASDDNTHEMVLNLANRRVVYLRHASSQGGSAARNTGIRAARGEFVALLDSDDEWLLGKLGAQITMLSAASSEVGLIYTGFEKMSRGRVTDRFIPTLRGDVHKKLLYRGNVLRGATSSALIRRECFEKVGYFDESLPAAQDYDMWLRLTRLYLVDYVPQILVRIHTDDPARITHNNVAKRQAAEILNQKYASEMSLIWRRSVQAKRLAHVGYLEYLNGSPRTARALYVRALRIWPFLARTWLYTAISFVGLKTYRRLRSVVRPFT